MGWFVCLFVCLFVRFFIFGNLMVSLVLLWSFYCWCCFFYLFVNLILPHRAFLPPLSLYPQDWCGDGGWEPLLLCPFIALLCMLTDWMDGCDVVRCGCCGRCGCASLGLLAVMLRQLFSFYHWQVVKWFTFFHISHFHFLIVRAYRDWLHF